MHTLTEERTIGEIAAEFPASVRIFEKYDIDYCCGGRISLADACAGRGIAPERLIDELDVALAPSPGAAPDWQTASLTDLIDHILTKHHAWLKTELPRLSRLQHKVAAAHAAAEMPAATAAVRARIKISLPSVDLSEFLTGRWPVRKS